MLLNELSQQPQQGCSGKLKAALKINLSLLLNLSYLNVGLSGVFNPQPMGCMQPRMAMNSPNTKL